MSRVTEALKRAQRAHRNSSAPPPPGPPLQPVEPAPRRGFGPLVLLVLALLLVIACAGILSWHRPQMEGERQHPTKLVVHPATVPVAGDSQINARVPGPATTAELPGAASPVAPMPDATSAAPPSAVSAPLPASVTTNETAVRVERPAPKPESFRLQGILYSPAGPTAVINGKSLRPGERIGGGLVIAITPASVVIVASGRTNVLTLE